MTTYIKCRFCVIFKNFFDEDDEEENERERERDREEEKREKDV